MYKGKMSADGPANSFVAQISNMQNKKVTDMTAPSFI